MFQLPLSLLHCKLANIIWGICLENPIQNSMACRIPLVVRQEYKLHISKCYHTCSWHVTSLSLPTASRLYYELVPLTNVSLLIFQEMPRNFLPTHCTILSWLLLSRKTGGLMHLCMWCFWCCYTTPHLTSVSTKTMIAWWGVHLLGGFTEETVYSKKKS